MGINNRNNKKPTKETKSFQKPKKVKNQKNLEKCKELDKYRCKVCGRSEAIQSHHIINRSLGGDDSLENLITLCHVCHRNIHDGKLDLRKFLNSIDKFPPAPGFRWRGPLDELNRRK